MKHCIYCGNEYSDEVEVCPADGKPLRRIGEAQTPEPVSSDVVRRDTISPEEQRFWERMTFRQFAILIVRLQAMWLLFYAVVDATYLSSYFAGSSGLSILSDLSAGVKRELFLAVLRIIMHVAAAIALIQHAEKVLSWLVKDDVPKQPPRQHE